MEMPRSGFARAVTCTPSACSRSITPFQLDPSAKAPCTRTTVGRDPSCRFMLIVLPPWFSLSLPSCNAPVLYIRTLPGSRQRRVLVYLGPSVLQGGEADLEDVARSTHVDAGQ